MEIVLLKPYKPHARELKVGTQMGVTQSEGERLISKGIARDVTKSYKATLQKKRDVEEGNEEPKKVEKKEKK